MGIQICCHEAPMRTRVQLCTACEGEDAECPYCLGEGTETVTDYAPPFFEVDMSLMNGCAILAAIDPSFTPEDPCGTWAGAKLDVVLLLTRAVLEAEAYDRIVRPCEWEGNYRVMGIDTSYVQRRLTEIEVLLVRAKEAGYAVSYS